MSASLVQGRAGSILDFRRLLSASFSRTRTLLGAEEWLIDMKNLLKAARVPAENHVNVVKVQLIDIA